MGTRKTIIVLAILLIAVSAVTVAFDNDDYNLAYKAGYMDGYSSRWGKDHNRSFIENQAKISANDYYGKKTTDENKQKKSAFKNGYIQGWNDKKNGVGNRYFED